MASPPREVTFDLMSEDPDYYFVLTTALGEFAAQARTEAREGVNPEANTRWAETAESALWHIEVALATVPATAWTEAAGAHDKLTAEHTEAHP